jgi:virulence-associated protein VagC
MSTVITAKVFKSGRSFALQLPRALKVRTKGSHITRTATGFEATVPVTNARQARV